MFGETLGARIRQARLDAGISGTQLARLIGRSQPYISDLERGQRTPSLHTLQAIAAALGKPTSFFLDPTVDDVATTRDTPSANRKPSQGRILIAAGHVSQAEEAHRLARLMAEGGIQCFIFRSPREVDRDQLLVFLRDMLEQTLDRLERLPRSSHVPYEEFTDRRRSRPLHPGDFD